jgi:hypothetical protein
MSTVALQNKTLRLFKGPDTGKDWHDRSTGYSKDEIANIQDPAAGSRKEITSIPSPFARVHLFENAFDAVGKQAKLKGWQNLDLITAYHQLVSDSLDVAEVFFNYEVFNMTTNNLKFILWNKKNEIEKLKNNPAHRLFGETLEMFMEQDNVKTHFDQIDNFYLLVCNNVLLGGTSPSTLFFAAHNEGFRLSQFRLGKGDDQFFDSVPMPLWKRSMPFQRYLFGLFMLNPTLKTKMSTLWRYMEANLEALKTNRNTDWQKLNDDVLQANHATLQMWFDSEYAPANYAEDNTGIFVHRGIQHRRAKGDAGDYSNDAFAIKTTKYKATKMPLALQNNFAKALSYCQGTWKDDISVPYFNPDPLERRVLPGATEVYPYLTVSDFLEPHILRIPYPMDSDYFYNGNPEGFSVSNRAGGDQGIPGDDSFLLPLTKRFFEFFDPEYINGYTTDGRRNFRMIKSGSDGVEVQLLLPIQSGDYILFKRVYQISTPADAAKNEGCVTYCRFDMGFYPLFHVQQNVQQIVVLSDGDILPNTRHFDYKVDFYLKNGQLVTPKARSQRQDKNKHQQYVSTKYAVLESYYDYMTVSNGEQQAVLIPKWREKTQGNKSVSVAIDFGTTNSFLALSFQSGNDLPKPERLEIKENERFLITLSEHWVNTNPPMLKEVILRTLAPYTLGEGEECFLPMRTIVTEIQSVDHFQAIPGTGISIPYFFERRKLLKNEDWFTNLKWAKTTENAGDANNARTESYLAMLLFMARNQIIMRGGDLRNCKLIWTYPASIGEGATGRFARRWDRLAKQYLGDSVQVESVSEALAPFYAYDSNEIKSGQYPVLNVDIGGGTADVILFRDNHPEYATSFRFAGNVIFGNGYAGNQSKNNGLTRLFSDSLNTWIKTPALYNIKDAYEGEEVGILNMGSADINSFFFSLETNKEVRESNTKLLSFSDFLSDQEDVKVVFIVFFSAIVYHIAHMMKRLGQPMPRQITFSGRGARIVNLLDSDKYSRNAAGLAKVIIERVYGAPYYSEGLEVMVGSAPKEKTCYGAINMINQGKTQLPYKNVVLLESKLAKEEDPGAHTLMVDGMTEGKVVRYSDVNSEEMFAKVEGDVREFLDFIFDINKDFSFANKFEGPSGDKLMRLKTIMQEDLRSNLKTGLKQRLESIELSEQVTEPLFFYPLVGSIYRVLDSIAKEAGK